MSESVIDLERHRVQLEGNISKLQKSLRYWQTWEAEYEGLKEEILGLGDRHTHEQLTRVGDEFGGELLNQKEINLLLEDARGHARSSQQILGLLERRIEYVQTNTNSVKSLLQDAETKAAASVAISQEVHNDEGLPLIEIREDLDDEGNVVSSSITSPRDAAPLVTETLRKSGVEELLDSQVQRLSDVKITDGDAPSKKPAKVEDSGSDLASAGAIQNIESTTLKDDTNASVRRKKSVSFAKGTKEEDATTSKSRNIVNKEQKAKTTYLRKLLRPGMPAEEIVNKMTEELKRPSQNFQDLKQKETKETSAKNGGNPQIAQDSNLAPSTPLDTAANNESRSNGTNPKEEAFSAIIPTSDTAEEAALRQEMLQYQTAEVGPVVAQIDLDDEDGSEIYTGEDDPDAWTDSDEANGSDAEDEEDEDQYGRTKHRVIGDEYRQEMLALEDKLNVRSLKNIGPGGNNITTLPNELSSKEAIHQLSNNATTPPERKKSPTKEVRFATDIQAQDNKPHSPLTSGSNKTLPSPLQQNFPSTKTHPPSLSRFKAQRTNNTNNSSSSPTPSPIISKPTNSISPPSIPDRPSTNPTSSSSFPNPPTGITSATIIERPYQAATSPARAPAPAPAPTPPSSEDPALMHQQLTTEYHKLRNRMIYRQGGFLADDDEGEDEQEEEEEEEEEEEVGPVEGTERKENINININEKVTLQNLTATAAAQGEGEGEGPPQQKQQHQQKKISRFRAARLKSASQ